MKYALPNAGQGTALVLFVVGQHTGRQFIECQLLELGRNELLTAEPSSEQRFRRRDLVRARVLHVPDTVSIKLNVEKLALANLSRAGLVLGFEDMAIASPIRALIRFFSVHPFPSPILRFSRPRVPPKAHRA